MSTEDLFKLEKEGIGNTIINYASDSFIRSYSKQLTQLKYPEDKQLLKEIIYRLVEWYENNIDYIRSSDYVYNKDGHEKSYSLLQDMKSWI